MKNRLALPVLIALSACAGPASGGSGSIPAAQPESVVRVAPASYLPAETQTKRSLYLVNTKGNSVDIYPTGDPHPKMSGQITNGIAAPLDVYIDKSGTVYVLNQFTVTEYPAGQSTPSVTINLGSRWHSYAISVGPNGTIYLVSYRDTNFYCDPLYGVVEYDAGAQSPSRTINIPGEQPYCNESGGLAVNWSHNDKYDDLYVVEGSLSAQGSFYATEYKLKGQKPDGDYYSNGEYALGALETDAKGELIAGDTIDGNIQVFGLGPAGGYRSFGIQGGLGWYESLDDVTGALYLTNINTGVVSAVDYKTGKTRYQFGNQYVYGLAVDPPSL